jgi:hypothetical protein
MEYRILHACRCKYRTLYNIIYFTRFVNIERACYIRLAKRDCERFTVRFRCIQATWKKIGLYGSIRARAEKAKIKNKICKQFFARYTITSTLSNHVDFYTLIRRFWTTMDRGNFRDEWFNYTLTFTLNLYRAIGDTHSPSFFLWQ